MSLLRSARLPISVRPRALGWKLRRALAAYMASPEGTAALARKGFDLRALALDEARLQELRARSIRRGYRAKTAFAASTEGRAVHRAIQNLSERIAAEHESILGVCG